MVNVIINELRNVVSVYFEGPYLEDGKRQEEQHEFSLDRVSYFIDDYHRWILAERKDVHEFEYKYIYSFPADIVLIQYIR